MEKHLHIGNSSHILHFHVLLTLPGCHVEDDTPSRKLGTTSSTMVVEYANIVQKEAEPPMAEKTHSWPLPYFNSLRLETACDAATSGLHAWTCGALHPHQAIHVYYANMGDDPCDIIPRNLALAGCGRETASSSPYTAHLKQSGMRNESSSYV